MSYAVNETAKREIAAKNTVCIEMRIIQATYLATSSKSLNSVLTSPCLQVIVSDSLLPMRLVSVNSSKDQFVGFSNSARESRAKSLRVVVKNSSKPFLLSRDINSSLASVLSDNSILQLKQLGILSYQPRLRNLHQIQLRGAHG